ncbi:MAG: hypothetical protein V3S64_00545 [bacterium]
MIASKWKIRWPALPAGFMKGFSRIRLDLLVLSGLMLLMARPGLNAAEGFSAPPGVNIKAQVSLLKERVSTLARNLVGDKLVDVVVDVNYLRSDRSKNQANRVKLPGFYQQVILKKNNQREIVSDYTRVRQILVMIADTFPVETKAVAQELRLAGKFSEAKGDSLRVLKVPERKPERERTPKDENLTRLSQKLKSKNQGKPGKMPGIKPDPQETLSEAESTVFLLRARAAFFKGNYSQALDQILRSIARNSENPQAYTMLGSLYYAVDWKIMAVKYWKKALALAPENPELRKLIDQVQLGTPEN